MMRLFGIDELALIDLHTAALAAYGGNPGIRDPNGLAGVVGDAVTTCLYRLDSDNERSIDALTFGVCIAEKVSHLHLFVDGNKRVAWSVLVRALQTEGLEIAASEEEAAREVNALVTRDITVDDFQSWVATKLVAIE